MRNLFLVSLVLGIAACQSMSPQAGSNDEAAQAIQSWANAFNSCDANKAVSLYGTDAVLWGTVTPAIISTSTGIRQYFERLCSSAPQPKVALGEQMVRVYGDTAINSGTYTFTVYPRGQALVLPSRYSFTYRRQGGQWLIVDHHSSPIPAPPPAAPAARQ